MLSGNGLVGVILRCGTGCTFNGVVVVVDAAVLLTLENVPPVVVVDVAVVIKFWLGYVIVPGLVRTRIPS